jgi:hypothetical protein
MMNLICTCEDLDTDLQDFGWVCQYCFVNRGK